MNRVYIELRKKYFRLVERNSARQSAALAVGFLQLFSAATVNVERHFSREKTLLHCSWR
jgi:hypothetical protein